MFYLILSGIQKLLQCWRQRREFRAASCGFFHWSGGGSCRTRGRNSRGSSAAGCWRSRGSTTGEDTGRVGDRNGLCHRIYGSFSVNRVIVNETGRCLLDRRMRKREGVVIFGAVRSETRSAAGFSGTRADASGVGHDVGNVMLFMHSVEKMRHRTLKNNKQTESFENYAITFIKSYESTFQH